MKNLLILTAFFWTYFIYNTAVAQSIKNKEDQLQGNMELVVNVSEMKDTAGRFMLMIGGEILYPRIENSKLTVNKILKEPRRAFLAFYPHQTLKANPGKALNEIAAGYSDHFYFLSTPGNINIIVKENLANCEFASLSDAQSKYRSLLKLKDGIKTKFTNENHSLIVEMQNATNKTAKDSLVSIYYKLYKDKFGRYYQDSILGFIRNHSDSPASLIELEEYSYDSNKDLRLFTFLYNNLTDRMKALPTAKRIYNVVDSENFAVNSLLGKMAPNFSQIDSVGKAVSLNDFKGHITLLEFWASWCGPCRASNPALVKTYEKFSGKGFKILGVSLDDNRNSWLKAIKDDKLNWTHISDLKGWNNSVAALYHIVGVPANILIDEAGKVIGRDLDDKQLDEHLTKLLQK